jgi:hypothetical protein
MTSMEDREDVWAVTLLSVLTAHCVVNTLQIFLSTHRRNTREAEEK